MNSDQCHTELKQLLTLHNARVDDAIEYLAQVKQAIADNQLEQLQDVLQEPTSVLEELQHLENQRLQLMSTCGFDQDQAGFSECLKWCDNAQESLDELYQRLVERLVKLQHSVQLNSLLVTKGQERVRRSIAILTGQGKVDQCKTYSSNGKTVDATGHRDIAVA